MTHPCRSNPDPDTMHACAAVTSATTLCGLDVDPKEISSVAGYTQVCPDCFPEVAPQQRTDTPFLPFR
jgi:hypothetical protein